MKILLVFPFFPLPLTDGGRIGYFCTIKYLSRAHQIAVLSLAGSQDEVPLGELEPFCSDIQVFRRPQSRDKYCLVRGLFSDPPGTASKYWYSKAGPLLKKMVEQHNPDIVEFQHLHAAVYQQYAGKVPTVLRQHNVEFKVWERFAARARGIESLYTGWTAPRLKRYEAKIAAKFDRCIVMSSADARYLKEASPQARIEMIPQGVDSEYFQPRPDVSEEPFSMVLTGSFEWKPKQQSLRALVLNVFPAIKRKIEEAQLNVVGRGVPEDLKALCNSIAGVHIIGEVPDVRPHIAKASLVINYLESGGGIAMKVLEAMAMGKPVLCNSLAAEGVPAVRGREIVVADNLEDFVKAAGELLSDEILRKHLAENGYRRFMSQYSWHVVAQKFEQCYEAILAERHTQNSGLAMLRS